MCPILILSSSLPNLSSLLFHGIVNKTEICLSKRPHSSSSPFHFPTRVSQDLEEFLASGPSCPRPPSSPRFIQTLCTTATEVPKLSLVVQPQDCGQNFIYVYMHKPAFSRNQSSIPFQKPLICMDYTLIQSTQHFQTSSPLPTAHLFCVAVPCQDEIRTLNTLNVLFVHPCGNILLATFLPGPSWLSDPTLSHPTLNSPSPCHLHTEPEPPNETVSGLGGLHILYTA